MRTGIESHYYGRLLSAASVPTITNNIPGPNTHPLRRLDPVVPFTPELPNSMVPFGWVQPRGDRAAGRAALYDWLSRQGPVVADYPRKTVLTKEQFLDDTLVRIYVCHGALPPFLPTLAVGMPSFPYLPSWGYLTERTDPRRYRELSPETAARRAEFAARNPGHEFRDSEFLPNEDGHYVRWGTLVRPEILESVFGSWPVNQAAGRANLLDDRRRHLIGFPPGTLASDASLNRRYAFTQPEVDNMGHYPDPSEPSDGSEFLGCAEGPNDPDLRSVLVIDARGRGQGVGPEGIWVPKHDFGQFRRLRMALYLYNWLAEYELGKRDKLPTIANELPELWAEFREEFIDAVVCERQGKPSEAAAIALYVATQIMRFNSKSRWFAERSKGFRTTESVCCPKCERAWIGLNAKISATGNYPCPVFHKGEQAELHREFFSYKTYWQRHCYPRIVPTTPVEEHPVTKYTPHQVLRWAIQDPPKAKLPVGTLSQYHAARDVYPGHQSGFLTLLRLEDPAGDDTRGAKFCMATCLCTQCGKVVKFNSTQLDVPGRRADGVTRRRRTCGSPDCQRAMWALRRAADYFISENEIVNMRHAGEIDGVECSRRLAIALQDAKGRASDESMQAVADAISNLRDLRELGLQNWSTSDIPDVFGSHLIEAARWKIADERK